jgi:hypothetical protein
MKQGKEIAPEYIPKISLKVKHWKNCKNRWNKAKNVFMHYILHIVYDLYFNIKSKKWFTPDKINFM